MTDRHSLAHQVGSATEKYIKELKTIRYDADSVFVETIERIIWAVRLIVGGELEQNENVILKAGYLKCEIPGCKRDSSFVVHPSNKESIAVCDAHKKFQVRHSCQISGCTTKSNRTFIPAGCTEPVTTCEYHYQFFPGMGKVER